MLPVAHLVLALPATALPAPLQEDAPVTTARFAGPDLTPSPACLAVTPTGEVFVGVDTIGSLGKQAGRGRVVRLVDADHDGTVDAHTTFVTLDNPRGLLPLGDELYVLHTTFGPNPAHAEDPEAPDRVATGMRLVAYADRDRDGVADGEPRVLVDNLSTAKFVRERGTDHATNGIRMGIDGWIYVAVGDFGFHRAVDVEGVEHTLLGGGVLRVRPDGSETELYTQGLRNIYDVAIDPYLDLFTRGNTNDGGGWDVRFVHHLQTGVYGYPTLFKHFTGEILPAVEDLGGGSGTGALFLDDPRWPAGWHGTPLTADWGQSKVFGHRLTPAGATFRQEQAVLLEVPQVTDLDVDAAGVMYLAAWDGAGYWGSPDKGHVVRAVPAGLEVTPHPRVQDLDLAALAALLRSASGVARLDASQELVRRAAAARRAMTVDPDATGRASQAGTDRPERFGAAGLDLAMDPEAPLEARVAGLFTFAQVQGPGGAEALAGLARDPALRRFALRALADRRAGHATAPVEPFLEGTRDPDPRVRAAAVVGLGRIAGRDAWVAAPGSTTVLLRAEPHPRRDEIAAALLAVPVPAGAAPPPHGEVGPHATVDPDLVPAHLAVQALRNIGAIQACLSAVEPGGGDPTRLALWALSGLHEPTVVDGLLATHAWTATGWDAGTPPSLALERELLVALGRLAFREAPYDGTWWWNTRPDTHGPYYKAEPWQKTGDVLDHLRDVLADADAHERAFLATWNERLRLGLAELEPAADADVDAAGEDPAVDLEAIAATAGEVGELAVEDVLLALRELVGDVDRGRDLFTRQGCNACHTLTADETPKGPYMGQVGAVLSREDIATSILRPDASISQGFATVMLATDAGTHVGFVTAESATEVELRDITGRVTRLAADAVTGRTELDSSMMPPGLANALTVQQLADLVDFLVGQTE